MANQWLKFYGGEFLADPKIISLAPLERLCWVTLLCFASMGSGDGKVEYITEDRLMIQAGIDPTQDEWKATKGVLEKLESLKMVRVDNGVITLINWEKRQQHSLTPYERVKRYRDRKRNANGDDTKKITTEENRREENRVDKKRKKKESAAIAAPASKPLKPKSNPDDPFTLDQYITSMRQSPQRFIRLIGEYADEIKPELKTKGQWEVFTRRNVRTAKSLEVFSDEQIEDAIGRLSKDVRSKSNPKGFITTWTFETLLKYITK